MRILPRLLTAACLALTLAACSSGDEPRETPSAQPNSEDGETAPPTDEPADESTETPTEPPADPSAEVMAALEPMRSTMGKLKSLQVTTTLGGKSPTVTEVRLASNQDCLVQVNGGEASGEVSIRVVGGKGYIRGDERFWALEARDETEGKRIVSLLKGRWVRVEPEALGSYTASCSMAALLAPLEQEPFSTGELQVGLAADFKNLPSGLDASVFETPDQTTKIAVGVEDPNHLLALDRGELGRMDFSKFNENFSVQKPNRTVPLSLLQPKS